MTTAIIHSNGRYEFSGNILSYGWWVLLYSDGQPAAFRGPLATEKLADAYAAEMEAVTQ